MSRPRKTNRGKKIADSETEGASIGFHQDTRERLIPDGEMPALCFTVYACARARCAYSELIVPAWTASSQADLVAVEQLGKALIQSLDLYRAAERKRRASISAGIPTRAPVRIQQRISPVVAAVVARQLTQRCAVMDVKEPPALLELHSRLKATTSKPDRYFAEFAKRTRAAEYLAEHPDASNAAVARACDVSAMAITKWHRDGDFWQLRLAANEARLTREIMDIGSLLRAIEHRALVVDDDQDASIKAWRAKRSKASA